MSDIGATDTEIKALAAAIHGELHPDWHVTPGGLKWSYSTDALRQLIAIAIGASRSGIGIGYTLATGRLFCDFPAFQGWCEALMARPLMTHEFADEELWVEMRGRYETLVEEEVLDGK